MSYWNRLKFFILNHLSDEVTDIKADSFTKGFGEGYKKGFEKAKEQAKVELDYQTRWASHDSIPINFQVDLFNVIDARKEDNAHKLYIGGKKVENEELRGLKSDVTLLRKMRLWSILQETLKQRALEKAVLQSKNWEECLAGKMLLHDISLRNSVLDAIDKSILEGENTLTN